MKKTIILLFSIFLILGFNTLSQNEVTCSSLSDPANSKWVGWADCIKPNGYFDAEQCLDIVSNIYSLNNLAISDTGCKLELTYNAQRLTCGSDNLEVVKYNDATLGWVTVTGYEDICGTGGCTEQGKFIIDAKENGRYAIRMKPASGCSFTDLCKTAGVSAFPSVVTAGRDVTFSVCGADYGCKPYDPTEVVCDKNCRAGVDLSPECRNAPIICSSDGGDCCNIDLDDKCDTDCGIIIKDIGGKSINIYSADRDCVTCNAGLENDNCCLVGSCDINCVASGNPGLNGVVCDSNIYKYTSNAGDGCNPSDDDPNVCDTDCPIYYNKDGSVRYKGDPDC